MNDLLKNDARNVREILFRVADIAGQRLNQAAENSPSRYVPDLPLTDLPLRGIGADGALAVFDNQFAGLMTNSAGPRYFGFVTGGSTPAAVAGDWLVSAFDQNVMDANESAAPQLERQTIHYLKQLFGLDSGYFGTFVTGATMANVVSLAIARQWLGHRLGVNVSTDGLPAGQSMRVLSATPHSSIEKSLAMLGMGRKSLLRLETLPGREALDPAALEQYLVQHPDQVPIVVANAGTVNTADFDDLAAIGRLKEKYPFWLHLDGAFGGFAACSEHYADLLAGINSADSITIDAHKWLNVPYDAAMQFTRHPQLQAEVFHNQSAYLGDPAANLNFIHYTPENSRRFRALPAWFTLLAYGREGYREIVERNCTLAKRLGKLVAESGVFRLLAPVRLNVVCFTLNQATVSEAGISRLLARLRDSGQTFMTPTVYKGTPAIRAAVSNWQTEEGDIRIAYQALMQTYREVFS
jgi:glutamate/tyrosine decarboxylase-like PLP-dependent enzyme